MKIHVMSETYREEVIMGQVVSDIRSGQPEVIIHHTFGVRVISEPEHLLTLCLDGLFNVHAKYLPPDTKVGDEFMVYFERVKK